MLTNDDVADILALLDSLPYDELDLEISRFRLILRRRPEGWTQSTHILAPGNTVEVSGSGETGVAPDDGGEGHAGGAGPAGGAEELVAVRAPLPGTFYRAPRPGAAPFVEAGSRVSADSVVGIVETMKLMNPVHAGVAGTVAEICPANGDLVAHGATLVRIEVDR